MQFKKFENPSKTNGPGLIKTGFLSSAAYLFSHTEKLFHFLIGRDIPHFFPAPTPFFINSRNPAINRLFRNTLAGSLSVLLPAGSIQNTTFLVNSAFTFTILHRRKIITNVSTTLLYYDADKAIIKSIDAA